MSTRHLTDDYVEQVSTEDLLTQSSDNWLAQIDGHFNDLIHR